MISTARRGCAAIFSETDLSGRITYVNQQFCSISGYSRGELLGANHRILNSGLHEPAFFLDMWSALAAGRVWKGEICNRAKDGSLYWVDSTMVPLIDPHSGKVHKYVSIRFDVTEKRQLLHTLQWRVGHDVLTGLPNRAYLSDLLNQALAFSRRERIPLAVCMLDLDGFKAVNDGYGHATGDLLLVEVAQRLQGILRGGDAVARLSGDEFVLILRHIEGPRQLHAALQRVLLSLAAPYVVREHALTLSASIGVTLFPRTTRTPTPWCVTPTRRCTWPSSKGATATTCSTCPRRWNSRPRTRPWRVCARPCARASCACTTNRK